MNKHWQTCTKLVDFNEKGGICVREGGVFFRSLPKNIRMKVDLPFYLNCTLSDMGNFLDRKYVGVCMGQEFQYELRRDYAFIREIERKLLWRVAQSYRITRPLIFAPWARRAVQICVTDGLDVERLATSAPEIDGKRHITNEVLQAAGLKIDLIGGVLVTNKRLSITNLKLSDKASNFVSDGFDENGHFFNVQEDFEKATFVLPTPETQSPLFISVDESGRSQRVYTNEDFRKYHTLTFDDCNSEEWLNVWRSGNSPPRLRTVADISHELTRYQYKDKFACRFERVVQPQARKSERVIQRYESALRYPGADRTQELFRATTYRPTCYLKFSGEGLFLEDYANYVLEAMENQYPEFIWAGEYTNC